MLFSDGTVGIARERISRSASENDSVDSLADSHWRGRMPSHRGNRRDGVIKEEAEDPLSQKPVERRPCLVVPAAVARYAERFQTRGHRASRPRMGC